MSVSKATVTKAKVNYTAALSSALPVGADLAAFIAVISVEAGGEGIDARYGRPIIRFEVHKFFELYGYLNAEAFNLRFKFDAKEKWKGHQYTTPQAPSEWIPLHTGTRDNAQMHEWYAMNVAMQFDNVAHNKAIEATSWGAGQIMGFHWKRLGFASPKAMMEAANTMDGQVKMLVNFIVTDPKLYTALKNKDWRTFARIYNGAGQVDTYAAWLTDAYNLAK